MAEPVMVLAIGQGCLGRHTEAYCPSVRPSSLVSLINVLHWNTGRNALLTFSAPARKVGIICHYVPPEAQAAQGPAQSVIDLRRSELSPHLLSMLA